MHLRDSRLGIQLKSTLAQLSPGEKSAVNLHSTDEDDGPVSELVDSLIQDAIAQHISDIHIEPFADNCRIRFRRDGLLYEVTTTPSFLANRIITRLKIMSHLNIAERRIPQDGRLQLQKYPLVDIRINTCPTIFGEKIVLRLLDSTKIKLDINTLGLMETQNDLFISALTKPQGLILVTGPTGSGKTLTLYTALHFLNSIEKNISSVEDPVEIELAGINQININPHLGLDFAAVLRTLLRQDPDIIMIGEIRDPQTAAIAMQAAQTGHLVLSTLHSNSAIDALPRLQAMGITPYHFANTVSLIIAQRLIRKLCDLCKAPLDPPPQIGYQPIGCDYCHQGYQGRTGIFELLPMTEKLASLIMSKANQKQLIELVRSEKWMLLKDAGMKKINDGMISHSEFLRIIG